MRVGIVTPDGPLLSVRRPTEHQLLEALATLRPSKRRDVVAGIEQSRANVRPAVTVVISPGLAGDELKAIAVRARGTVSGAVVLLDAPTYTPGTTRRRTPSIAPTLLAFPVVTLRSGDSFAVAWQEVISHAAVAR
jgi:hypothetical protein